MLWPGIIGQLKHHVQDCRVCRAVQRNEPLLPTSLPTHPWEEVGAGLFRLDVKKYMSLRGSLLCHALPKEGDLDKQH